MSCLKVQTNLSDDVGQSHEEHMDYLPNFDTDELETHSHNTAARHARLNQARDMSTHYAVRIEQIGVSETIALSSIAQNLIHINSRFSTILLSRCARLTM